MIQKFLVDWFKFKSWPKMIENTLKNYCVNLCFSDALMPEIKNQY